MGVTTVNVKFNNNNYVADFNAATGEFVLTLVAPEITSYNQPGHYYGINLHIDTSEGFTEEFIDFGKLFVKELTAPIVEFVAPYDGTYITPDGFFDDKTVVFNVIDSINGSGVDPDTISAELIDELGETKIITPQKQKISGENGYICNFELDNLAISQYNILIKARDFDGNNAPDTGLTVYSQKLITDRTLEDVSQTVLRQAAHNMWPHKGSYDNRDFNRIGSAMQYLKKLFEDNGASIQLTTRANFLETELGPLESETLKLLTDINNLKQLWPWIPNLPATPETFERITYVQANQIERILEILIDYVKTPKPVFYYSNEIYSGEMG